MPVLVPVLVLLPEAGGAAPAVRALGKIFVCFYIHLALVCIAVALSHVVDAMASVAAAARKRAKRNAMKQGVQKKSTPKAETADNELFHEPTKAEKRAAKEEERRRKRDVLKNVFRKARKLLFYSVLRSLGRSQSWMDLACCQCA